MAQFKAMAPGVEVNGETVLSVVAGMGVFAEKGKTILSKAGIQNPMPGMWYPQQAWLDAFRIIAETVGPKTLTTIGSKIPESAKFPPSIDSIEKALAAIDMAYHMNHRKGEIGKYGFELAGPTSAIMVCKNPYPCEFDLGIILSMARRFKPVGSMPTVDHVAGKPCRKQGADSCTYKVAW
jgi:hypothetical protein